MFLKIEVVYEDEALIAINKPAGIVVNRSQTSRDNTIQDWIGGYFGTKNLGLRTDKVKIKKQELKEISSKSSDAGAIMDGASLDDFPYGKPAEIFVERSGIAHRLDKETSGILLIAKTSQVLMNLMAQFKNRSIQKTYLSLVHGKVSPKFAEINLPIGRNRQNRLQFAVREDGKQAVTRYEVREFFPHIDLKKMIEERSQKISRQLRANRGMSNNLRRATKIYQGFSLLEVRPKTGRTHQIRVHLAHLKHPIVGDKIYLGKKRKYLDSIWCQRHFLHAEKISFQHPISGENMSLRADLAEDLQMALKFLTH